MNEDFLEPHMAPLIRAYLLAKLDVVDAGFEHEIAWQESVRPALVTARVFVREAAWVILCSGMKERVVRGVFDRVGRAMEEWAPPLIARGSASCRKRALREFGHVGKVDAILEVAARLAHEGPVPLLDAVRREGPLALTTLPYIGPTTCYHLAKNLGYQVPKPDRHLVRIAAVCGRAVDDLCTSIAAVLDEPVSVVDIVLWRYATLKSDYLEFFAEAASWPSSTAIHSHQAQVCVAP